MDDSLANLRPFPSWVVALVVVLMVVPSVLDEDADALWTATAGMAGDSTFLTFAVDVAEVVFVNPAMVALLALVDGLAALVTRDAGEVLLSSLCCGGFVASAGPDFLYKIKLISAAKIIMTA